MKTNVLRKINTIDMAVFSYILFLKLNFYIEFTRIGFHVSPALITKYNNTIALQRFIKVKYYKWI